MEQVLQQEKVVKDMKASEKRIKHQSDFNNSSSNIYSAFEVFFSSRKQAERFDLAVGVGGARIQALSRFWSMLRRT